MAYGLKYKLDYCDADGNPLRLEILERDYSGSVHTIEGASEPFILSINNDKSDKSGYFQSTTADISVFSDSVFNIDNLISSDETQLRVDFYKSEALAWAGFVMPDFFDEEISNIKTVNMTASDRLGTLNSATLDGLSETVTLRSLLTQSLAKTGLSLALTTSVTMQVDGLNVLDSKVLSQRLVDTKGRNISCYDIIKSICVLTNSFITQQGGEWYLQNKLEHEAKPVNITFSDVNTGGRRKIQPVGAEVGVFQEFGGGRLYPKNYDFSGNGTNWTAVGDFVPSFTKKEITGFEVVTGMGYQPVFGEDTNQNKLIIDADYQPNLHFGYKSSSAIVSGALGTVVDVNIDLNGIAAKILKQSFIYFGVYAEKNGEKYILEHTGNFVKESETNQFKYVLTLSFEAGVEIAGSIRDAVTASRKIKGTLEDKDGVEGYEVYVIIYGSTKGTRNVTALNYINFSLSGGSSELPKGNIFKTIQSGNYTKAQETDTTIFGDYITRGLNGYFYDYPIDDTSSLLNSTNQLTTPTWTAFGDSEPLPVLQHSTRQRARMFSSAHNILNIDFETDFNHLDIFGSCGEKYVFVSGEYQFRKRLLSATIEEVKVSAIDKRDYIYSYFGGSDEKGISSISGISGGGTSGGGGGGLTAEQLEILNFWKKDPDNPNTIYTDKNAYSTGELSAYGIGSGGSSGGGVDLLQAWTDYDATKDNWAVKAGLLVPFYNDMQSRVGALEASGGGGGSTVTWGTESGGYVPLTVESVSKSVALSTHTHSQYALTTHNHSGVYEPAFTKNTAFNKNFGTTAGTVAEGNDSRINNGQTAYGWGNHASAGYALNSSLSSYLPLTGGTLTGNLIIQPASQVSFGHGIRLNDVGGWAGLLIGGATGTTSGHDGTTNWWVASNPDDVFMINPLGSLVGQGLDIYRNGDIKWKGNNIYHSGNLSPVTTNTVQTITAQKTFSDGDAVYGLAAKPSIILGGDNTTNAGVIKLWGNTAGAYGLIQATGADLELSASSSTGHVYLQHYGAGNVYLATGGGNVGIGIGARPATEKLQVDGNILATGTTTTTKVIFNSAGWSMEQVGSELQLKYNNLIASRFLSDGSIVGLGEITAYGASTGGEGVSLLRTGGTMTGNLTMSADIIMNSGSAIGVSNLPLKLLGNALTYNASNVLTEANTATQIKMGNDWTIEQTTSALTIKKNGVVKGTFNA